MSHQKMKENRFREEEKKIRNNETLKYKASSEENNIK